MATLEADFQGAREYRAGGIGPLFQERRLAEPHKLWDMLSRTAVALAGLGITGLAALFIDEEEIALKDADGPDEADGADDPGDDIRPEDLADEARRAYGDGDPAGFMLIYTHDEERFSHVISVEASTDHPYDEAGISVLVRATPIYSDEELDALDEDEREEDLSADMIEGADPAYEYVDDADPGGDLYAAVQRFIREIQAALTKELALDQPDVEIWYETDAPGIAPEPGPLPGVELG